jgi:hypothetical protein
VAGESTCALRLSGSQPVTLRRGPLALVGEVRAVSARCWLFSLFGWRIGASLRPIRQTLTAPISAASLIYSYAVVAGSGSRTLGGVAVSARIAAAILDRCHACSCSPSYDCSATGTGGRKRTHIVRATRRRSTGLWVTSRLQPMVLGVAGCRARAAAPCTRSRPLRERCRRCREHGAAAAGALRGWQDEHQPSA